MARALTVGCLAVAGFLLTPFGSLHAAGEGLRERVAEIEHLSRTAGWRESQARIESLRDRLADAPVSLRTRVDLVEARNRALEGRMADSLARLDAVLERDLPPDLTLRTHALKANISAVTGDYTNAFRHLQAGLDLLARVDDPGHRSDIFGLAAWLHGRLDQLELARGYAEQAVVTARETGDPRELCVELQRLAVTEARIASLETREETLEQALDRCREAGDPVYLGATERQWGELLVEKGEQEAALTWMWRGLDRLRDAGYRLGELQTAISLAEALLEDDRVDEAAALLEPVLTEEGLGILDSRDQADAFVLRADIAEAMGRPDAAIRALRRAATARERHFEEERNLRQTFVQASFRTDLHEQELALLRERARVAELEETARRQRQGFLLLGYLATALVSVLLFVLLMRSRRDRRHFRRMSQRDSLTELLNHSHFFALAEARLREARETGRPFSLVIADIDYFKQFNDRYGHAAGDGALRKVSALFREVFGDEALIGRIGGEEFGVALPDHDGVVARDAIERFREALIPLSHEGRLLEVTLSYGLIEAGAGSDIETLRRLADEALYRAKGSGRDRVVEARDDGTVSPQ